MTLTNFAQMKSVIIFALFFLFEFSVSAQNGKLFLVAGQSNAVGQGESTLSAVCNQGTAFEYNATTDALQHLQDPMGQGINNLNSAVTGSVGPAFAKTLNSLISQPIYMISAARSGSSLHAKAELSNYGTWDETGTLAVFGCAVAKTKKAIQKTGLALSGIIWLQGERDANAIAAGTETEAEYKETLIKLIARFRAQFGYRLPFYIVLTGLQGTISNGIPVASSSTGNYKVRQIQMEVAKTIPNVFVAFTSTHTFFAKGLMKPEGTTVHYTQPAYNQIGDSVARFVATIPYDTIAKVSTVYQPVNSNPQIIVDNTDAACTFDASWTITTNVAGYYGLNFAYSSSATSGSTKWAKWTPTLPVNAMYRIYMRWASSSTRASFAPVEIQNADNITNLNVNQCYDGGKWNYLCTSKLNAGTTNYVKIYASEPGNTIADAVLFEQINDAAALNTTKSNNSTLVIKQDVSNEALLLELKLDRQSKVSLSLYTVCGVKMRQLIDQQEMQVNNYSFSLQSQKLPKGVYFAQLAIKNEPSQSLKFLIK